MDGTAFHLYGGDASLLAQVHDAYPKKNLYLTEQSVTQWRSGPLGIAEPVRRVMIGATRNWCRNVLLWNLAADPQNGPHTNNGGCTECSGAITLDGDSVTKNVAYYVLEHFSQFVPPGISASGFERDGAVSQRRLRDPGGQSRAGGFKYGKFSEALRREVPRGGLPDRVALGISRDFRLVARASSAFPIGGPVVQAQPIAEVSVGTSL